MHLPTARTTQMLFEYFCVPMERSDSRLPAPDSFCKYELCTRGRGEVSVFHAHAVLHREEREQEI